MNDPSVGDAPASAVQSTSALAVRVRDDGIAIVTYDVPGEAVNTLRPSFSREFQAMLAQIAADARVTAAVLISGKRDTFIAGADIEMLKSAKTAGDAEAICRAGHETVARLAASPKPIVAAIHGAALGGGFEVALACQARVLSDDPKTVLGFPEVQLGLIPGLNGLQRLAEKAGLQVALDHGLTGKNMRPAKAKQLGVADDVVPRAILEEVAVAVAQKLAIGAKLIARRKKPSLDQELTRLALEENPLGRAIVFKKARAMTLERTHGHYPAPLGVIDVLKTFASGGFEASKEIEARTFGELAVSPVARRLMELFFATNALKKDNGVDDPSVKAPRVERIFVLGAGLMGSGIGYVSAALGDYHVRIKDRDDAALQRGFRGINEIVDDRVTKRQLTRIEAAQKLANLTLTTDDTGLASSDLVIEAVFEDLAVKQQVLRNVEEKGKPGIIFASNTSSIPIGKIAEHAAHPELVVGMHYFSPVNKMPLLEVIRAAKTDAVVVATAVAVGKKQGKTVIVVNDGVGFYTTRVLAPYLNEACWLLMEGLSVETIDQALVDWGWPVGPLTLVDEVGIDVAAHIGDIMQVAFGGRVDPAPVVGRVTADGRKGRKNEKGFYLYGEAAKRAGKGKHVDRSIYDVLGLATPKHERASTEEIQMRCSLQLINESVHCLGEHVLRSARDGDVGAVMGLGFPPFRGGPFRFVDAVGPAEVLRRMEKYEATFGDRFSPAPLLREMAQQNRTFYGS